MILVKENFTKMMNNFGEWLVKWRGESGLSLRNLEKRINKICTFGYLNQLEQEVKGKKGQVMRPDENIVEALAVALNRPIDEARLAAGYKEKRVVPDIIKQIDFSIFTEEGLKTIKTMIEIISQTRPDLIVAEADKDEIRAQLGFNIEPMSATAHTPPPEPANIKGQRNLRHYLDDPEKYQNEGITPTGAHAENPRKKRKA
jgi:transcriptional regulator with XRE-family HTH domain